MSEEIIISLTTIPGRKDKFSTVFNFLISNSDLFDRICINLDEDISNIDKSYYKTYELLPKVEIIYNESKWKSCNKLLGTLKKYPDATIITVDDDIIYKRDWFLNLIEKHKEYPEYIIANEANPIYYSNEYFTFKNEIDFKLNQIGYSKYLSNFCLFPAHTFDNTDVFNYDKMLCITQGNNDELWFWINSTLCKQIPVIQLTTIYSGAFEIHFAINQNEYNLTNINVKEDTIKFYNDVITTNYKNEIINLFKKDIIFNITNKTVNYMFLLVIILSSYYKDFNKIKFVFDKNISISWKQHYYNVLNNYNITNIELI